MIITVVVPVYNVEKHLEKCLDSIINQTYKELDIIIVDDCSLDSSSEIAEKFILFDSRVRLFKHDVNKGLSGARNTGIDNAIGDYISFVDSDDWLELCCYEKLSFIIQKNKYPDIVKFGRVEEFFNYRKKISPKIFDKEYQSWELMKHQINTKSYKVSTCDKIFKIKLIKDNNIRFIDGIRFEDMYFSFVTSMLAKKYIAIEDNFYHYLRVREGSITNTINSNDVDVLITISKIFEFIKKENINGVVNTAEFNLLIYRWICHTTLYRYVDINGNKSEKYKVANVISQDIHFKQCALELFYSSGVAFRYRLPALLSIVHYPSLYNVMKLFKYIKNRVV